MIVVVWTAIVRNWPLSTFAAAHHFGSDGRNNGHAAEIANRSKLTRTEPRRAMPRLTGCTVVPTPAELLHPVSISCNSAWMQGQSCVLFSSFVIRLLPWPSPSSCLPSPLAPLAPPRRRHPLRRVTLRASSTSGPAAACIWSAGARAVRWSCLKLATAAPPGSGARTSTSRGRRGRWCSQAWPFSPVFAPMRAANENLATLVPNARFFVAKDSGHDIHQDQPELVIEAIRQVVVGVRLPATWYDLTSCCTK